MSANLANGDSFYAEINDACERFEAEWQSGGQPQIEVYVAAAPEGARPELIRELLKLEICYLRERGETVPGDYKSRFPDQASLIDTLLGRALLPETPAEPMQAGRYRLEGLIGRGGMGDVYRAHDPDFKRPLAVKVLKEGFKDRPDMVARFLEEAKITGQLQHPGVPPVHEIGHLPDGRPFLAMKLIEGRTLAELLVDRKSTGGWVESSRPTTVHAGLEDSTHPMHSDLPRFLAISEQICQTLAYAHSRRIIHRDLKPLNIMVGAFGEVQVMDWGLAKSLASTEEPKQAANEISENTLTPPLPETIVNPTRPGAVMGTLAYMPPEQARGEIDQIDERSDVFSLGAMLCEFLTGEPPYREPSAEKLWEQARKADLGDAFRRLDACGADAELITLAKQCFAAEKNLRPRDAGVLAAAVTGYQSSVEERLRRAELERTEAEVKVKESRKRRRVAVALGSLVFIVLTVGIASTLSQYQQVVQKNVDLDKEIGLKETALGIAQQAEVVANNSAESEKKARLAETEAKHEETKARLAETAAKNEAQRQLARARQSVLTVQLQRVAGLYAREPRRALDLLDDTRVCPFDLRDFSWGLYRQWCRRSRMTVDAFTGAISPDGKLLATANWEPEGARRQDFVVVKLWDVETGEKRATLKSHRNTVFAMAFFPDCKTLVAANPGIPGNKVAGEIKLWDLDSGTARHTLQVTRGDVRLLAVTPDGKVLAAVVGSQFGDLQGAEFSEAKFWDTASGLEKGTLKCPSGEFNALAFSPDGKMLATAGTDKNVRLWDWSTGEERANFQGHTEAVQSVAWSQDGKLVASGSQDKTIRMWDIVSGMQRTLLTGHTAAVRAVALSSDGSLLASGGVEKKIRLWDLRNSQEIAIFSQETGSIESLTFSSNGRKLLSTGGPVTIWDVRAGESQSTLVSRPGIATCIAYPNHSRLLAAGSEDGTISLWDPSNRVVKRSFKAHEGSVSCLAFSPDGETLASGGHDSLVKLWDIVGQKQRLLLRGHSDAVSSIAIRPDGKVLASAGFDRTVRLWDMKTGNAIAELEARGGPLYCLAFDASGTILAGACDNGTVQLWDAARRAELRTLGPLIGEARTVAFSPDGQTLAAGSGARNDMGQWFGELKLWDVATGQELASRTAHDGFIQTLAFTRRGSTLASGSDDGTVKLWDATAAVERATLAGHAGPISSLAFNADDSTLAVAGGPAEDENGRFSEIKLWSAVAEVERTTLKGHSAGITSLCFDADGSTLISTSYDGTLKRWDYATGQERASSKDEALTRFFRIVPGTRLMIELSQDGSGKQTASIRELVTGRVHATIRLPDGLSGGMALSANGKIMATVRQQQRTHEPTVTIHDLTTGEQKTVSPWRPEQVRDALHGRWHEIGTTLSPDGRVLAIAYSINSEENPTDVQILLWDLNESKKLADLAGSRKLIPQPGSDLRFWTQHYHLRFSPDGKCLAVGPELWHLTPKLKAVTLSEYSSYVNPDRWHTDPTNSVAFSPDGRLYAVATDAGPVKVWDVSTGKQCASLMAFTGNVTALAFAPDSKVIAIGDDRGVGMTSEVKLWKLPPDQLPTSSTP